jgi:hypothetical protein
VEHILGTLGTLGTSGTYFGNIRNIGYKWNIFWDIDNEEVIYDKKIYM